MKKQKINKHNITTSLPIIVDKETDSYLNNEVKDYAFYVVQTRAVPNIMDGLRVGARKILHSAITGKLKHGKKEKMAVLIGNTNENEFHHGPASLQNTIEQLGSKHLFELHPLNVLGQTGTLRVPDVHTADRYLVVQVSENIDLFKTDNNILDFINQEGKFVEPKYFLPIIPIILLWRTNSPGFGFSFRSFSHDVNNIIDACISAILNGTCSDYYYVPIKPKIIGIKDENIIHNESKNSWYNIGQYEINLDKDTIIITDLPYNISYRKYIEHLQKLKDENYIYDFENHSQKGIIKYIVVFSRNKLKSLYSEKWKFYIKMKLFVKITKLTLNAIDNDCKSIINFESTNDLVDAFVKRRLVFFNKRKLKLINEIETEIKQLNDKIKFIKLVVNQELIVFKRKIVDVKLDCDRFEVSHDGLKLAISKLTIEEIEKSLTEIDELNFELNYYKNTNDKEMYIKDLIELKSKISSINIYKEK